MTDAGMGHNSPPIELKTGPELIAALTAEHAALIARCTELTAGIANLNAKHPTITDDETVGKVGAFVKQIRDHLNPANETRKSINRPYDAAIATTNGFFQANVLGNLEAESKKLAARQSAYLVAKEYRERKEAAERARIAQEQAEAAERQRHAAEQAAAKQSDATVAKAITGIADEAALVAEAARLVQQEADALAQAPAAELSRVRSGYGTTTSLRVTMKFRVVDISKVPVEYLVVDEAKVNALIRGERGVRKIEGLEIFEHRQAVSR